MQCPCGKKGYPSYNGKCEDCWIGTKAGEEPPKNVVDMILSAEEASRKKRGVENEKRVLKNSEARRKHKPRN